MVVHWVRVVHVDTGAIISNASEYQLPPLAAYTGSFCILYLI